MRDVVYVLDRSRTVPKTRPERTNRFEKQDPFILSRRDIVKSIIDGDTLYRELKSIIIRNNVPIYNFAIIKEPIENIIRHMESFLCQN